MSQVLFENCTVLDTGAAQLLPDRHVLVEDDRIVPVSAFHYFTEVRLM